MAIRNIVGESDLMPTVDAVALMKALKEFHRQVELGVSSPGKGLSLAQIQMINGHQNPFPDRSRPRVYVPLFDAINILGAGKVITPLQTASSQKRREFIPKAYVRYPENVLREAAESNRKGETDFFLVYVFGDSLWFLHSCFGTNLKEQPCFRGDGWWMRTEEGYWAASSTQSGYYLLDFKGRYGSMNWIAQEDEIAKLGPEYERASEVVVTEAAFAIFKTTGVRVMSDWYHWGKLLTSSMHRVFVGDFNDFGMVVDGRLDRSSRSHGDRVRVVVVRKPLM